MTKSMFVSRRCHFFFATHVEYLTSSQTRCESQVTVSDLPNTMQGKTSYRGRLIRRWGPLTNCCTFWLGTAIMRLRIDRINLLTIPNLCQKSPMGQKCLLLLEVMAQRISWHSDDCIQGLGTTKKPRATKRRWMLLALRCRAGNAWSSSWWKSSDVERNNVMHDERAIAKCQDRFESTVLHLYTLNPRQFEDSFF